MSALNCRLCEFLASCALPFTATFYVTARITLVINCIVLNSCSGYLEHAEDSDLSTSVKVSARLRRPVQIYEHVCCAPKHSFVGVLPQQVAATAMAYETPVEMVVGDVHHQRRSGVKF
jgi:hypothetical protein